MQETPTRPVVADEQLAQTATQPVAKQSETTVQKGDSMKKPSLKVMLFAAIVAIIGGVATGWGSYGLFAKQSPGSMMSGGAAPDAQVAGNNVKAGDVYGSSNEDAFPDSAEGYLEAGGIDGEGSHKLLRAGGPSQTVYLTSSVTDLDKLVGMEVKIWGETFKGQKAGWLMDVGRVEVINPDGAAPEE